MINDEFVEEFIREVEMELASLAPVEKAVEDALDSMKSEIDPNVKIDESMLDSVKQKAKSEGERRVLEFKDLLMRFIQHRSLRSPLSHWSPEAKTRSSRTLCMSAEIGRASCRERV